MIQHAAVKVKSDISKPEDTINILLVIEPYRFGKFLHLNPLLPPTQLRYAYWKQGLFQCKIN